MLSHSVIKNIAGERIDFTYHPAARRDILVILGHGLTGNKDRPLLVALAEGLSEQGYPCMRISYAGNGKSGGRFENATITKEIGDLRSILESVPDYVRVIYIGHSMGAAVGVLSAAKELQIRILISLAGMCHTAAFYQREFGQLTPGKDVMWEEPEHPLSKVFADDLKSIGDVLPAAARVSQPWLLIHGTADDVVPIEDSRAASKVAISHKKLVEIADAGHSFEDAYPQVIGEVLAWLKTHLS